MNPRYDKRPPRVATDEDKLQKEIFDAARAAAVTLMKAWLAENRDRLVRTLDKHDVDVFVETVLAAYCVARSECEMRDAARVFDMDGIFM